MSHNVTDKIKEYQIWTEGYRITCESGTAKYFGTQKAETFNEAVRKFFKNKPEDLKYINESFTSYWCCRFFDNEMEARKTFG